MKHIRFVELDVMDSHPDAIELYKNVGFKIIHQTPQAFQLSDGRLVGDMMMRLEIKK